jgi:hypothetical protein
MPKKDERKDALCPKCMKKIVDHWKRERDRVILKKENNPNIPT